MAEITVLGAFKTPSTLNWTAETYFYLYAASELVEPTAEICDT